MGKNIRSSSSPKALATSFPMPPLADAMDAVRLSVDRFCLLAGVEALAEMMEEDATTVCGARHRRHGNRRGYRWGHTQSEIGYHGGRVKVQRPRVRDHAGKEVGLESWQVLRDGNLLLEWALNLMVLNVSTRKYHRAVRLPEGDLAKARGDGTSKSAVSRRFCVQTVRKMPPACGSSRHRRWRCGAHPCRARRSSSRPCSTISSPGGSIRRCPGCSSSMARRRSAKRSATPSVMAAAIQRCQVHKGRNIIERLTLHLHASVKNSGPSGLGPGRRRHGRSAAAQPGSASGA